MIGNLPIAFDIFKACRGVRKHRGQQIVRTHPLDLRRNFFPTLKAQQSQRPVRIPSPARAKNRRIQRRLLQNRLHRFGLQKMKYVAQGKAVLFGQRDVNAVIGGGGLQLEVKRPAEALAQRKPPGLVDAATERGVDH